MFGKVTVPLLGFFIYFLMRFIFEHLFCICSVVVKVLGIDNFCILDLDVMGKSKNTSQVLLLFRAPLQKFLLTFLFCGQYQTRSEGKAATEERQQLKC